MQINFLKIKFLLLVGILYSNIYSQETILSSGGNAIGVSGSVSYSLGQVIYNNFIDTKGSLSQGVQQPFEIYMKTEIRELTKTELNISVYPNPVSNKLILSVSYFEDTDLTFILYTYEGELLLHNKISSNKTDISFEMLKSSVYILQICKGVDEIKTFKIVKN